MSWLCILIILTLFNISYSLDAFLPSELTESQKNRRESLVNFLRTLADKHFSNCTLDIIYDSNFELNNHPIDFNFYFADVSLTFTQEKADFLKINKTHKQNLDKCINYLIFLDDIFTISHIMDQNVKSKIVIVASDTPWEIKDFLKSHHSKAYLNLLIVTHSISRRANDGDYLLYTHNLYADGSGSTEPLFLASWINNSITVNNINLFPDKLKTGFMGHRLLVSTVVNPPFVIKRFGSDESTWDGLEVRLLRLSGEYLNFTTEFTEPRSTMTSPIASVKNDVLLGITSAAVGGIYGTLDASESFDMTTPFAEDCAAFISLASTALPKYRAVLGPFQLSVWLMLCFSYFILIVPLTFNSNYTLLSLIKHPKGIVEMFWYVFSTYTNSFVIKSPLLDYGVAKNAITILLGIYWVFTIIITACYTGSIVAFITLPVYPVAIESASELLYYRYRIGTLDHDGWENWFNVNNTDDPFLHKLFQKIEYVPTLLEGVQNASRAYFWPYAFLASRTTLDYLIQTDFAPTWTTKRTLMHISDECFVRFNVVQLFPTKSLYTNPMNKFVSRAWETGLVDKIITDIDWEIQRTAIITKKQITKRMSKKIKIEDRILTVEDTQGMFLILGSGVLMALLALSFESIAGCIERWKNRHRDDDSVEVYWSRDSPVDSWIIRENTFHEIRHRKSV